MIHIETRKIGTDRDKMEKTNLIPRVCTTS